MTAQRPTPKARDTLPQREFTIQWGETVTSRTIADEELLDILAEHFGLEFPPGTRFRGEECANVT
ncbi:MAG TPA: hypothetical protein VEL76_25635 [Gemmataceae bacterium]|nr:hypothetical protein [Gemmataceae bacterium]